jgi:hypothetical protein
MGQKFRVFAVASGMHTEVETGKGADANIDFFIRRFTSWMPALSHVYGTRLRPPRMPTDTV